MCIRDSYKKYVSDGAVVIQGWGTGDSEALRTKVSADKLPFMSASYAEVLTDPKQAAYNFVVAPTYSDQMRVALNWIAKDSGGKAEVAVFHNDSPFGTAPVADGQKWITEKSLGLGFKAYPMPKTPNFVGLLSQAQSQGAKYIVIQNVSSPAAQVAKARPSIADEQDQPVAIAPCRQGDVDVACLRIDPVPNGVLDDRRQQ